MATNARLTAAEDIVAKLTEELSELVSLSNVYAEKAALRKADPAKLPVYVSIMGQIGEVEARLKDAKIARDEIARAMAENQQMASRSVQQDLAAHPSTYAAPGKWAHVVKHDDEPCWDRDLAPLSFEDTKAFSKWARGKMLQDPTWEIPAAKYPVAALAPMATEAPKKRGRKPKDPLKAALATPMTTAANAPVDEDDDELFAAPAAAAPAEDGKAMLRRLMSIGFTLDEAMAQVEAAKTPAAKAPATKPKVVPVIKRLMPMVTKAQNEVIIDGIVKEISQRNTKDGTKQVLLLEAKDADGDVEMVHTWNNSTDVTFTIGQMVTAKGTVTCRWSVEAKMRGWQYRGPVTEIRSAAGDVTEWQA